MRILAIIEAASVTGPAKNLLQFGELVRQRDWSPRLEIAIASFCRGGGSNPFLDHAAARGFRAFPIPESRAFDASVLAALRECSREFAPDVVQTHNVKSHFLLRLSGIARRVPWIAFHHGYTTTNRKMRLYNRLDRWSLRGARRVLTVSEAFRRQLVQIGVAPDRITVLHNAIDPAWGERVRSLGRAAAPVPAPAPVVLTVGRLSHEKAHVDLVAAVARIPQASLVIVGEGPERQRIESEAARLGMSGRLWLPGQVSDVAPFYAAADVVVLSSLTEGSPNALLEAMAAGVPVVATRAGGIPEIVADRQSALLVDPARPGQLAEAIAYLLDHPDTGRALAAAAAELIRSRHDPVARARRLTEMYAAAGRTMKE